MCNTFIVRHFVVRVNKDKTIRKIVFYDHATAIQYISELREHETLQLFKQDQRKLTRRIL